MFANIQQTMEDKIINENKDGEVDKNNGKEEEFPSVNFYLSPQAKLSYRKPMKMGGGEDFLFIADNEHPFAIDLPHGMEFKFGDNWYHVVSEFVDMERMSKLPKYNQITISLPIGLNVQISNGVTVRLADGMDVLLPSICDVIVPAGTKFQQMDSPVRFSLEEECDGKIYFHSSPNCCCNSQPSYPFMTDYFLNFDKLFPNVNPNDDKYKKKYSQSGKSRRKNRRANMRNNNGENTIVIDVDY